MVNNPLLVWKENHSMVMFRCYFRINKGHNYILLVYDDNQGKVTDTTWKDILQYLLLL